MISKWGSNQLESHVQMEGNKLEKGQMQRFSTTSKSTFQQKKYQYKWVDKEAIPFMESKFINGR